jgi:hypothetical protein
MTIIEAIEDPALFRPLFRSLDTWRMWCMVLKAVFALEMTEEERVQFTALTSREMPPVVPVNECWFVIGRRGGKSFIVAVIAVFIACFRDHRPFLGPGETGVVMVIATDRKQARVIHRYVRALLNAVPMLAAMIQRQGNECIDLDNHVSIEITTASYRTIRGFTVLAALCDEIAFWRSEESANPAEEILSALRPAMATIPGSLLIGLGTPYKRSGPLYDAHKRHYAHNDSPVLVIQAETRTMNPSVSQSVIDAAFERDPIAASAEYLAQFRSDVGSFLDVESIERAIETGRLERPPQPDISYVAFCDPSGGAHDAFTLAIAHRYRPKPPRSLQEERDQQQLPVRVVLDVCRGIQPPFDPSSVVKEFAALLRSYRCSTILGDRYSAEWVVSSFRQHGIQYKHSELTKSELYLESLPLFMTQCVELLDVKRLTSELMQLERRTARSGKDSVDHPPQGHDDYANSCAGALALCTAHRPEVRMVKLSGW